MSSEVVVRRTLAFQFPDDAVQPTQVDMVRFIKSLKSDPRLMDTAYKVSDEKAVFIRFKNEEAMKFTLENNEERLPFHYNNGKTVMVHMSIAGNTRYVRIFDLPPEIPDSDLRSVMTRFGIVKRIVRERFPAEYQLDMFNGIRGLHMEVEKEIPKVLFFRNHKGTVHYDGIKLRCFACKSDSHLKKACPIVRDRRNAATKQADLEDSTPESDTGRKEEAIGTAAAVSNTSKRKSAKPTRLQDTKQRPSDSAAESSDRKNGSSSTPGEREIVPASLSSKIRCRIASYYWIQDEDERQQLIAEDKMRIAEAMNTTKDKIDFFIDSL